MTCCSEPTTIYVSGVKAAVRTGQVHAIAHITGVGLPGNIPRVLPDGIGVHLDPRRWSRHAVFDLIQKAGNVEESEMRSTFNLGLGWCSRPSRPAASTMWCCARSRRRGTPRASSAKVAPSDAVDEGRVTFVGG